MTAPEDIISDEAVTRVHGYANFGDMTPREVLADGVLKYAMGYSGGHTQLCILMEHKLIKKPKPGKYYTTLTKLGQKYLRAAHPIATPAASPEVQALRDDLARVTTERDEWADVASRVGGGHPDHATDARLAVALVVEKAADATARIEALAKLIAERDAARSALMNAGIALHVAKREAEAAEAEIAELNLNATARDVRIFELSEELDNAEAKVARLVEAMERIKSRAMWVRGDQSYREFPKYILNAVRDALADIKGDKP